MLVAHNADVNAQGKYSRSPLYRAAFAGAADAVLQLLQCGSDPRLHDNEGIPAVEVSANKQCRAHFEAWDIAETDRLLVTINARLEADRAERAAKRQAEIDLVADDMSKAEETHTRNKLGVKKAHAEYERLLYEYDLCTVGVEQKGEEQQAVVLRALKVGHHRSIWADGVGSNTASPVKINDAPTVREVPR